MTQKLVGDIPNRGSLSGCLLFTVDDQLAAVSAHKGTLLDDREAQVKISVGWILAIAIATQFQGMQLASGLRLSSLITRATMRDAISVRGRQPIVGGFVAAGNSRSRRMCRREGFEEDSVHEMVWSDFAQQPMEYVWVSAAVRRGQ